MTIGERGNGIILMGAVALLALAACGRDSETVAVTTPVTTAPAIQDETGALYLRLDTGTILRSSPSATAEAVHVLESRGSLRVEDRQGDWYQIVPDAEGDGGWVRFSPDEARGRALRIASSGGPRRAVTPEAAVVTTARRHLREGGRVERCGPYTLITDVTDGALIVACQRIGAALDDHVARLYGVAPLGEPAEAILLFDRRRDFRAFAESRGTYRAGYAAYARGAEGFLAGFVEDQPPREVVQTLAHEMTHLVLRRALGSDLPRWLSEGLADGVGDATTIDGLRMPRGALGVEAELQRLRFGLGVAQVGGLEQLTTRPDDEFDRGTVSYDYELSAVFVRWLLDDAERARGLRSFLSGLAAGNDYDAETLLVALDATWRDLDQRLSRWIRTTNG